MARLILHVGQHKTATTTVQDVLAANRALLAGHGVIYPDAGRHSGHHGFLTDWLNLPAPYHLKGGGGAALATLAAAHRDSDHTVILSSEEMSRAGGPGGRMDWPAFRALFEGYEIRLICVLRPPWQFLQSVWLELARTRVPPPPPVLIEEAVQTGQADGLWCDHDRLRADLGRHFAGSEMDFPDFADLCAAPGGVVGGLMRAAGVALDPALFATAPRSNVSPRPLPRWAALMIAAHRPVTPGLAQAVESAFDLEYGAGRPSCLFTRAELARLAARFEAQPAPPPPEGTLMREEIGPEFWLRAARRLWMAPAAA